MSISMANWKPDKIREYAALMKKREASPDLTDEQIEVRLHNLASVIAIAEERDTSLVRSLVRKREETLNLRLSRDVEKILERHDQEWDDRMRPKFQRGLTFKLRPRQQR